MEELYRVTTWQDDASEEIDYYCKDGLIRAAKYTLYATVKYDAQEPNWTTKDGLQLKPSQMTPSHRENCLKIVEKRLAASTTEEDKLKYQFWVAALSREP